jgi:hypothetical protein
MDSFQNGEPEMRLKSAILFGSIAAFAVLAAPSFAKNSEAQKTSEPSTSTSPSCHNYQQAPDGSWKELPCQEMGSPGATQHKPSPHSSGEDEH